MTRVWVTHTFAAAHHWPDAPAHRRYLASTHRHLFHVDAEVTVRHDDREVEFHDLQDVVAARCAALGTDLGAMSCEMVAAEVLAEVRRVYPGRSYKATVSEDGECGATVEATDAP